MLNGKNIKQGNLAARILRLTWVVLFLVGDSGCSVEHDGPKYSWSIAQAKKKGSLVCEVQIIPNSIAFAGKKITFEAAWLERLPDGDYALCLRVDQGKEIFKEISAPFFVRGERKEGFEQRHGRSWLQFIERLDSDDLSLVRASLIKSWKEDRPKNIRFVRKDK